MYYYSIFNFACLKIYIDCLPTIGIILILIIENTWNLFILQEYKNFIFWIKNINFL